MPNKYPGGYQIIDLGDLREIDDNGIHVPGLFDLIKSATKPVIPTAQLPEGYIIKPKDMAKMTYCSNMSKTMGEEEIGGCGWASLSVNCDDQSVTALAYVFVTENDIVYIAEI